MANKMRKARIAYVESRLKEKGIKSNRGGKRSEGEKRARAQFRSEFRAKRAGERGRATSPKPSKPSASGYPAKRVTSPMPSRGPVSRSARDSRPRGSRGRGAGVRGYR